MTAWRLAAPWLATGRLAIGGLAATGPTVALATDRPTGLRPGGRSREPGRDPARGGEQDRAAAPAGAQRDYPGGAVVRRAESVGEPHDRADVGTAERVDGLVRIPDHDQFPAVTGQGVQQRLLGRVGVLVFVHQDHVVSLPLPLADRAAGKQRRGDPDDLGVVVGRNRRQVEPRVVAGEEGACGDPVIPVPLPAQPGERPPVKAALRPAQQEVAQFRGEAPGAQRRPQPLRPAAPAILGLAAQQPPHLQQLLRARQQGRRLIAGQRELAAHQRVRVAVEGQRQGLAGGAAQPGGDPLAQFLRGLAAERQDQHPVRVDAAPGDAVHHGLDDRGGLPRARPGQNEQRQPFMIHDGPLRRVEDRGTGRRGGRAD